LKGAPPSPDGPRLNAKQISASVADLKQLPSPKTEKTQFILQKSKSVIYDAKKLMSYKSKSSEIEVDD